MTQIEKIKAEIERLKEINEKRFKNIVDPAQQENIDEEQSSRIILRNRLDKAHLNGQLLIIGGLLSFIESLEQEPISTEETELNSIAFLEQMGYTCISDGSPKIKGWVARDKDGELSFFSVHPMRFEDYATKWCVPGACIVCHLGFNESFPDLKWEDEPIEVELTLNRICRVFTIGCKI